MIELFTNIKVLVFSLNHHQGIYICDVVSSEIIFDLN